MKEVKEMNRDWAEEQIEAYVDGSLSRQDRHAFEQACAADPALTASVQDARQVRKLLRSMATPQCPPDVTATIMERVRREAHATAPASEGMLSDLVSSLWRPALVVTALLAFALVLTRPTADAEEPVYAAAEVDVALEEVKWTLAYLNGVGTRTGATIRTEVFGDGVVRPLERGLGLHPPLHRRNNNDS